MRFFKETEGDRAKMCKAFEELAEKRAKEAALEEKRAIAKNMLKNCNLSIAEIAIVQVF